MVGGESENTIPFYHSGFAAFLFAEKPSVCLPANRATFLDSRRWGAAIAMALPSPLRAHQAQARAAVALSHLISSSLRI